jgi:hypothetical protein
MGPFVRAAWWTVSVTRRVTSSAVGRGSLWDESWGVSS